MHNIILLLIVYVLSMPFSISSFGNTYSDSCLIEQDTFRHNLSIIGDSNVIISRSVFYQSSESFNKFSNLFISGLKNKSISIKNNDFLSTSSKDCDTDLDATISIVRSTIKNLEIINNRFTSMSIFFVNDTFRDNFFITQNDANCNLGIQFNFENCVFYDDLKIVNDFFRFGLFYSSCKFTNCQFKSDVIISATLDAFQLDRCTFDEFTSLDIKSDSGEVALGIKKTNIDNVSLPFNSNYKITKVAQGYLFYDLVELCSYTLPLFPTLQDDECIATYELLMKKYSNDAAYGSLHILGIKYEEYKLLKVEGFQRFLGNLSKVWWNFGYEKYRIIYWTLGFLTIFFFINALCWHSVIDAYTIIPLATTNKTLHDKTSLYYSRLILSIFLFTSFIFFSLQIDFDKLNYKKPIWVLWFFFQYIVGLICLFFIFNAVIKF